MEGIVEEHLTNRDGAKCAGVHIIYDLYGVSPWCLRNKKALRNALRTCTEVAGATLLHMHLHRFEENGGISGVAVLAESHVSVHTWPECGYAAFDVFMCGNTSPEVCGDILRQRLRPRQMETKKLLRGSAIVAEQEAA